MPSLGALQIRVPDIVYVPGVVITIPQVTSVGALPGELAIANVGAITSCPSMATTPTISRRCKLQARLKGIQISLLGCHRGRHPAGGVLAGIPFLTSKWHSLYPTPRLHTLKS